MSLCLTCMNKNCQSQGIVNGYTYCRDYSELKSPQNFPKANAYSLLDEVRAEIQTMKDEALANDTIHPAVNDTLYKILNIIDSKIGEHFS